MTARAIRDPLRSLSAHRIAVVHLFLSFADSTLIGERGDVDAEATSTHAPNQFPLSDGEALKGVAERHDPTERERQRAVARRCPLKNTAARFLMEEPGREVVYIVMT